MTERARAGYNGPNERKGADSVSDTKREPEYWEGKHFSLFTNHQCEYFPCHKGADPEHFNCLFCYCPLYALGPDCGGNFRYLESGIKDCSACLLPHRPENYGLVTRRYQDIVAAMRKLKEKDVRD